MIGDEDRVCDWWGVSNRSCNKNTNRRDGGQG